MLTVNQVAGENIPRLRVQQLVLAIQISAHQHPLVGIELQFGRWLTELTAQAKHSSRHQRTSCRFVWRQ